MGAFVVHGEGTTGGQRVSNPSKFGAGESSFGRSNPRRFQEVP